MSAPPALSPWCNSLRTLAEVVGDVRLQAREGTILLGFTDHTVNVLIHSYLAPPAVNARRARRVDDAVHAWQGANPELEWHSRAGTHRPAVYPPIQRTGRTARQNHDHGQASRARVGRARAGKISCSASVSQTPSACRAVVLWHMRSYCDCHHRYPCPLSACLGLARGSWARPCKPERASPTATDACITTTTHTSAAIVFTITHTPTQPSCNAYALTATL